MHEIGINPRSGNIHHGTVRNPYDLDRDAGGSSSGSGAAVAAGFCPLAVGADGGGSIRIPAALCGVVGLKATYGRISGHGSFPLDWSVGHLGPLGSSVDDVVLAYAAMAGADPLDPATQHQPPLNLSHFKEELLADQAPLRLGIYREWFNHAEPEVVAICEAMLQQLGSSGAIIEEIEIPELDELRIAHAVTILSEMAASMANYPDNWNDLSAATRISLTIGKAATSVDYLQAQRIRTRAMACFAEVFKQVDVVISPSTAMVAPLIPANSLSHGLADLGSVTELMRFAVPGNMTGLPAISFPVGYSRAGLPVGMQAMGRPWEEHLLFRVARTAERLADRRVPPGYNDLLDG
jgi:Asp-tRNA(Asn)/Glu-tRNA(Gln) amidotransferase A subunit family amidase